MLEYSDTTQPAQILACHYAEETGDAFLIDFMAGRTDIETAEQALQVARGFWQMVDLAVVDSDNHVSVQGILDIEFWMHKLFNKVSGYLAKRGFEAQWDQAKQEADAED